MAVADRSNLSPEVHLDLVKRAYNEVVERLCQCNIPPIGNDIYSGIWAKAIGEPFDPVHRDLHLGGPVSVMPVVIGLMELAHEASLYVANSHRPAIRNALIRLDQIAREWEKLHGRNGN